MRRALLAALVVPFACMLHASDARADTSSWLSMGGGYGLQHADSRGTFDRAAAMTFGLGVGTEPTKAVVFGGTLRTTTFFSLGTDLGLAIRGATGGFARGQWGLAVDAGLAWRPWGDGDYGTWPVTGTIYLGMPWGFQFGVGGEAFRVFGSDRNAQGVFATLELDLLRLTLMRQGATDRYWENPSPAGGRMPRADQ